jgi:hypothetical protein
LEKKGGGRGYTSNRKNGARRDENGPSEYDENSDVRSNTGAWQPVASRAASQEQPDFEYSSSEFDEE